MFDFLFSSKTPKETVEIYPPFEAVKVDMHAHFLPNVDDGAPDLTASVALVREMMDLGFRKLIATPHVSDLYPNDSAKLSNALEALRQQLAEEAVKVELNVAAEYMINDVFEQKLLDDEPLLTLSNQYVLVELSHLSEPTNLYRVLGLLKEKNYAPVLAHPERYRYYNNNLMQFQKLINHGCHLQVNALSLDGYYGRVVSDCAWALLNNYMIEFIGTDVHHQRHISLLKHHISPKTQHILNNYAFQNKQLSY